MEGAKVHFKCVTEKHNGKYILDRDYGVMVMMMKIVTMVMI